MPAKKTASGSSGSASATKSRSRVTTALRKATGVVAKAAGRSDAKKPVAKKAPAKKAAVKQAATKKVTQAKKAASKKAAARKTPAKKSVAKQAPAKKTVVKKAAPAKKTVAQKTAGKKATPAKKTASKATTAKKTAAPAKQTAAPKTRVAKKTTATPSKTQKTTAAATKAAPTKKAATKTTTANKSATPRKLKVRDDESPWTPKELAAVRAELEGDVERLTVELNGFESDIAGLIKDSGDGAGDDQADAGAKTFEREHEYSLAQNSRDLLEQSVHALERIDDGTYGVCENCGNAIGKLRLQAFPRATLCLSCKAKQERR
jgi:RNA polymerase-binding transcription factor DksA